MNSLDQDTLLRALEDAMPWENREPHVFWKLLINVRLQ
jgi:hypothetical protein